MLIVVKTLCASLQMGLEQLADVNRAMEQHHNTLRDVHLRQTLCDAKHLFQSCQRKSIDFSFCLSTCFHCGIRGRSKTTEPLHQSINMFLIFPAGNTKRPLKIQRKVGQTQKWKID